MVKIRTKISVLGDKCVGKSAITQMFHSDGRNYPKNYIMTNGAAYISKTVQIQDTQDSVELFVFDISGHDLYTDIIKDYMVNTNMFIIVYDCTNEQSFRNLSDWLKMAFKITQRVVPIVLVANKSDADESMIKIKHSEGKMFARSNGIQFFSLSALNYKGIKEPFEYLAKVMHKSYIDKVKTLTY